MYAVCVQGVKAYMCCFRVTLENSCRYFMHDLVPTTGRSVHVDCNCMSSKYCSRPVGEWLQMVFLAA